MELEKKETGMEKIAILEKEIDDLSKAYEKIANYRYMLKNAQNTIKEDLRRLETCLSSFYIKSPESKYITTHKDFLEQLKVEDGHLSVSLEGIKMAIDVVDTKVGLLRGKESLMLQKQTQKLQEEGTSLALASSFIEFILVFYYSLASWEHLATAEVLHRIPIVLQATLIGAFSLMAVICTHYLAISWREHWKLNKGVLISIVLIGALVITIVLITQYYAHLPSHGH